MPCQPRLRPAAPSACWLRATYSSGNPAAAICKIETGRLRLIRHTVDDHLVILRTARRRKLFAEASLFADAYQCDAIAAAQSSVRAYAKQIVMEAMRTDPALRGVHGDSPASYKSCVR